MLDKPVIQALINLAHKRSFPPRHTIMRAGDVPSSLYLILEGAISVLTEEDGREMVLAYLNPGDFFGEMCLFPEQAVRTAIVRTRTPTLVAEVSYPSFKAFAHQYPDVMFEIAGQLAVRLRDTSRRLRDLAFLDVAGRIAHELLQLCNQPDASPHPRGKLVKISRQELARFAGCSREMAGRVLKKLEEDGVIASVGRSILVHDRKPAADAA
jgi:CRP/FNR family cyclic AMP-dependent transcriptional regulator